MPRALVGPDDERVRYHPEADALRTALDAALGALEADGTLTPLHRRWGLAP